jgi:hypothetical protein
MATWRLGEAGLKTKKLPAKYKPGFLREFDRRTKLYPILNEAYQEVMSDMGGEESLSHVQICLAERFVFLEFVLRGIELKIAQYPKKSHVLIGRWIQGLNSLSGLAKTIGLKRKARQITDLATYVKKERTAWTSSNP